MSTMFGFKKYISAIAILTDFKKTVDIILCQQSGSLFKKAVFLLLFIGLIMAGLKY